MPIPSLDIYWKESDAFYIIMHHAPRYTAAGVYLGNGCCSDLQQVSIDCFKEDGLDMVMNSLREFNKRRISVESSERFGIDVMPPKKRKLFFLEHAEISLSLQNRGEIWIDVFLMRSARGEGDPSKRVVIRPNATPLQFWEAVHGRLSIS